MEPEDLPWPGELEEEEEEEEEEAAAAEEQAEEAENLDEVEVVMVEDVEDEEAQELDPDLNYESPPRESTDDEEDEEAKAWLQAHPGGTFPPPALPKHRFSEGARTGPEKVVPLTSHVWQQSSYKDNSRTQISDSSVASLEKTAQWVPRDDQRTESWHFLPQEIDSSHTLDTTQTRFNVREEGTEVTDFPSVEEGILTQSGNKIKEPNRDLFCSPLLVIQDSFASPDLPLLTCLTRDQEFGTDSLFHQSELDFAPLRGFPGKSEDTEWFSRPSEVSEAFFQAAPEVASDLGNRCFSVSPHTLIESTAVESQGSFLHPEQGTKEETVSPDTVDELKTPKDSDSYDALCSYMSWKTQEVTQEPETNLADKDKFSFSTSSDTSNEYLTPKESDSFDASCSYVPYWEQEALQQSEKYLTFKDHYSCSYTIDKNKIPEGSENFSAPVSCMPWGKQGASQHPETCLISKDCVSFPHGIASHLNNKMPYSFLHCLSERRGKSVPLMSNFENVYVRGPAENEVKQKIVSLEGYERNEGGPGKELSQCFELKENSNTSAFSEVCPRSSEIQYIENVIVPDNSVKVSETHILSRGYDIFKVETSGGPLQTVTSNLDETSEQLYFQEERSQKASAAFGRESVDASENVAFEAVIASIEPSKKESAGNEIQTDFNKSLTNDSQESEPKNSDPFLLNYNDENSFFGEFSHPYYQSTPEVLEPATSKPLWHKEDGDVSSLYWLPNVKSLPSAPQEMFVRPHSFIPELKLPVSLSEKSHSQIIDLCKTQSALFQRDVDNEPFLPIGKVKSVPTLDLAEKAGSSNIIYPVEVSTSDSLFLQDLKQQTFEEGADSSNCTLGKNVNSSHVIECPSAAVESSFSANLVAYDAKSQGALPVISDASLTAVGQETLLKADVGLGEISRPIGAKSSFTIHTIMQNDSYFIEGLQGKSESDIYALGDDTECCSLDENAVVCSKRSTDLQREICDQGDLSGECIELTGLENLLDDLEICDSSLSWQSGLQPPSKEESSSEEPVGHSDMDINQSFSSVLPPFVPHEPIRELEYHSSDLRMFRVSPEIVPKTLKHLSGDISKGGITEITQSNLKAGITTTSGDSDIGSHLPLSPEDFPQLAVRSSVENTIGLHTGTLNQQILADGHVTEETPKVLAVPKLANQKTGISTVPSGLYTLREKPDVFYPQDLSGYHVTEEALRVSAVPGPADPKISISTVPPSSYFLGEKHIIFYQQALPDSIQTEEDSEVSAVLGPHDQKSEKTTVSSSSYSHTENHIVFSQQQLLDSYPAEQALKVLFVPEAANQETTISTVTSTSYSYGEKPHIFYQQTLPESHLTEQALKVSATLGSTEQKTAIPAVSSTSHSHREKPSISYQQELPNSHLTEQSQQIAAVSGHAEQKTGIPTGTSTSYSHGEKPHIFYQQTLLKSHPTEQALKVSTAPGLADWKSGLPAVTTSYSHREKPSIFYQQELPDSHLTELSQQIAAVSGITADQKTGIPTGTSTSYSHGEKPHIFYQQTLPESHLTEQALKVSTAPGLADQKNGLPAVTSTYSQREKSSVIYHKEFPVSHLTKETQNVLAVPGLDQQKTGLSTETFTFYSHIEEPSIFYQQELPDSHLNEQSQQVAAAFGFADQKIGIPTGTSTSFSDGEKSHIFYQQTLPESHLTEQALKVSTAPGLVDLKSGILTVTSPYSHREKPSVFYQQELPDSHLTEQSQQTAAGFEFTDQKTGVLAGTSTYSRREKPSIFYQQELPDSHLNEQSQQVAAAFGFADQKIGIPTGTSTSFSDGEKSHIFYKQTLPESHLTEQALKASTAPGLADLKSGILTVTSPYSHREKPSVFYQQELPDSHLTEQSQQTAAAFEFTDQKTGVLAGTSTSYSHREKPSILYQQELPDSHLIEQSQKIAAVSGITADQKTGIPRETSTSYSHGEKPHIFYQQTLPESHLTEQALKDSVASGLADGKNGLPTVTTTYSHGEKPSVIYQQELPISHLTNEAQKVTAVPGPAQQKTGITIAPPISYSQRGKTVFLYQQELPDSHLTEQAQRISSIPGPADQNTGLQTVSSSAYPHKEKPIIFYEQEFPDSHLTETLKVSSILGPAEQNTGITSGSSGSYSFEEKPSIIYQQALPDSHLTKESLKVLSVPGPEDQKTDILTLSSSSNSHREKPNIFYQQELPDQHLTEQAQKVSAVPGPAEQKTGIPRVTSTSYSHRETPFIFYPQGLPDTHLPEEVLKVSAAPGPADQKTQLPSEPSSSYSHTEKPIISYPQALPDTNFTEEALKISTISGPADQKTRIPTVPSTSYSHREDQIIISPQALPNSHVLEEALKVSPVPGPADQKTGLPSESSSSYSNREKPIIFFPQDLTESHLSEKALKVSAVPGPTDPNTRLPLEPPSSYSLREKSSILYQQELQENRLTEEALGVSTVPGTGDQKTEIPAVPPSFYPLGGKSIIFYQQALPDRHLTEEAVNVSASPGPADQKTGSPTVSSNAYSHREKSFILYPQALADSQLTEKALKDSAVPLPGDHKTGIPVVASTYYSNKEKPIVFYQQVLPDNQLISEGLKVSAVPGPADPNTRKPTVTSTSYPLREKSLISYQQELPGSHLTEEGPKVSGVPGIANQKTGIPIGPSSSYSYREKPIISYQQDLTQEALKAFGVFRQADQKTGIPVITPTSYSHGEKPIIAYQQELPDHNEGALKLLGVPGPVDHKTGTQLVPSSSYSHREGPIFSYQKDLSDTTAKTLEVSAVPGPADQKTGIRIIPSDSYSYRENDTIFSQQELPDTNKEALKVFALPGPADQKTEIPAGPSDSYSHKEKPKISTVILPDGQKTELPSVPLISYSHREKPKNLTLIESDDQKTPLLTVFHNSYSQRIKPSIFFKQHLPGRHHSEDTLKPTDTPKPADPIPEPTDVNSGIPMPLSSSYSQREKSNNSSPQELLDKHLTEDVLKVSTTPEAAEGKTVLPTAPPSFSHKEKSNISYQQDLPDRHLTKDALNFSSGLQPADQITGLSTVHHDTYSQSEKNRLVSDHVQRLIDNLGSSNSSIISNSMSLNSQAGGKVVINKPDPLGFEYIGSEEFRDTDNGSKTLKEIRTLLMEAENIALKRCNFPAPLVPFRDISDISFIQSKKVVCFKEPPKTDESNVDLPQRQPVTEKNPSNKYIQKDISTQTNLKCQRGIGNWEFISSTTVRSPLQEAESRARMALDETLRQYEASRSVIRSEPEGYSGTLGNKILIPMMTIIKSDSSSDASSCSWDSNSIESVSDVLLNLFPYASPKTSMTDSREEEGMSESDDGGGSSIDSLATHVKNLLKCESSLNHAKQMLRHAEEEECRVRARAWNLKFNMARECGYSISELNEDDRRKVEEIKAKLFGQERTTDLSKGLQSPRGIGCKPEAVCSHIIIESHEKGCFRTLTTKQPQFDSHPCVFRSAEPLEIIRGRQSPSSWRTRHINLSKSLDQSSPQLKVWNSLHLQSHSPFQNFTAEDLKISKGFRMPFREKIDPWLSEFVEPTCVPPEDMDYHSSSQMLPPESLKKFTTSITFSSHRHSKCFSDSSVLKVGVTEDSQCTGASVGVFNSHFTEEQSPPRDLKQETSSPSFKIISHSPDKTVTVLKESSRQGQKLSVEHSCQEEKLLERPNFKGGSSEPSTSTNCSKFKEVHFSDNHTLVSMGRSSSTLGVKEKNVTPTPSPPSHIFLEQQELFEQSKAPHADNYVRKHHSSPPQHQHYVAPNLPCQIFLEKRELFEESKIPHVDDQMRENHSPLSQGQDYIASDLPSSIFLEQRQLFEQSKAPDVDQHIRKQYYPLPQGQDGVVENNETMFNNVVSQSAPNQYTLVTSPSTPPSNRKALSCVRITLSPKTPSKLDSGNIDKRFLSLDPASKTRMNSEFNSDLQTISPRSLEPTSKLLTSKPVAHEQQQSLGFLGPKSSPDFKVIQSLPDSNTVTQDLKTIPFQNSQIVTSRQTQVNFSDLEEYSNPEGTPVSADRLLEEIKPPLSAFSGKLSSDAVTQITTESPEKTMFSSEIFINAEDREREIPESSSQKLGKVPVKFASSSSVEQITVPLDRKGAQPSLLPYKPSGSTKMYYVPQLSQMPLLPDSKSDTTIESTHSGSNDAIAPDFPAQVLGTRDDDLEVTVNIKHKEGIYSKRAAAKSSLSKGKKPFQKDKTDAQVQVITGDEDLSVKNQKKFSSKKAVMKPVQSAEKELLQKDTTGSSNAVAAEHSTQLQDTKTESLPDTKVTKQKEVIHSKSPFSKEAWSEDKESLQIDIEESGCHSELENTTHSVFRSAKFYFHHPVNLPSDQDSSHESLGRNVFMKHSWKDFFQHHPDKQRSSLLPPFENEEKTETDYTRIESVSIDVNLENKEVVHPTKSQARNDAKYDKQINDQKKDLKVTPEPTTRHIATLNELWNKYQERQRQQKPLGFGDRKELSLVERLDRLAKLLQKPITHSLGPSESTQDDSRGQQASKEWSGRQQQQKNKLQKKKRYKSLEKCHKNIGDLKKSKVLSTHQAGRSNQIKIEQVKFNKYILRKQPGFHYINTSSDSRPSEDSELLTDTTTNILSTTTSPVDSDILTQTDKEVTLHERSSSISTIDTARLIQAFGHERVCLSPRRIRLYSSITDHQRRYIEKLSKNKKKALSTGYPQMTSEHTRRKRIQVSSHVISSDSVSSSTSSFWSSSSTLCNKQNVQMLNKGVQAGNLEIVNGVRKHTRDVGVIFPIPSSNEARIQEDSNMPSWSEGKIEEKRVLGDKKLRTNKQSCYEGVSWFVPVENVKSGPKKENLFKHRGPGISWFAPITNTKPWREPLREQNWQKPHADSRGSPAGPGRSPPKPFVRASLQESLELHRPDFISRSGERIKRLKLIVQERKLQSILQSEREALFNTVKEGQGLRVPMRPLPKRGFLAAQKYRPVGKKEMIQRSKRIYEQLPEVQKKREEEKRRLEYKSYRLQAQLYKKKVTNQLLGRKVPWD